MKIINGILTACSIGAVVGMVFKMQGWAYGHLIAMVSFVVFAVLYPIQFIMMKQKNAISYLRFIIIWGVCLLYLYYMYFGNLDFLPFKVG